MHFQLWVRLVVVMEKNKTEGYFRPGRDGFEACGEVRGADAVCMAESE